MAVGAYLACALAGGGFGLYLGIGGLFEWLYYRRRRADAAAWKCQPGRWSDRRARRAELLLGSANLAAASIGSGLFAWWVARGGGTAIYFDLAGRGLPFTVATALGYFALTDCALYWAHRILHRKALFRAIHRVHHRWTAPTAFTAMAMHPLEFALYQSIMLVPLFVLPVHVAALIAVLIYQNIIALLDHSGVDLGSLLPWQPPPRFHDDHHVYFQLNYGQTLGLWDRLFGTWRRVDGRRVDYRAERAR
jgi:lathosterol oxidase